MFKLKSMHVRNFVHVHILRLISILVLFLGSEGSFLGGTISWMKMPGNTVRVQYRLAWEKGTGPCGVACNHSHVGTECANFTPELAKLEWAVHDGNTSRRLGDVRYVITDVSVDDINGWEQGEYALTYTPTHSTFVVALSAIPWVLSGSDPAPRLGYLETRVDTRPRNDTGRENASPYCAMPAYIGVAFECTTTVPLPVEDPEGETVRCRWAEPRECGTACTNVPNNTVWLDTIKCTLTVKAYSSTGYLPDTVYRLAIVVEDVATTTVAMATTVRQKGDALSRIPLQLTLRIASARAPCAVQGGGAFVLPTPTDRARPSYGILDFISNKTVQLSFYLETSNISATRFQLSGPMFLQSSVLADDLGPVLNRTNVTRLYVQWLPNIPPPWQQVSYQQVCVWGLDQHSVSTIPHCITDIVTDTGDFCKTKVTCQNNGTCFNLYKQPNEKCLCQPGYKGDSCSSLVGCPDAPCVNNGTCSPLPQGRYSCSCPSGYTGLNCEQVVSGCVSGPCKNGATCLDDYLSYTCVCTAAYTGHDCNTELNTHTNSSSSSKASDWAWLYTVFALLVLLLLAAATAGYLVTRGKGRRATPGNQGTAGSGKWATPRSKLAFV